MSSVLLLVASLWTGFLNPPDSAKPWCYYWWINGHVDRETITADLAAMKKLGFGGILMFDSRGYWDDSDHLLLPKPEIDFMSEKWFDNVEYTLREADRLGLVFTMNASASGGTLSGFRNGIHYEVDVTDRNAVLRHLEDCVGPLLKRCPELVGRTFKYIYSVSWEGKVPKGENPKARNELVYRNFYGTMRDWAHARGLQMYSESGGPCNFTEPDQFRFLSANDMPQGEFWYNVQGGGAFQPFLRTVVASAHLYGSRLASAEAFTHMVRHWTPTPFGLKRVGDEAFADGINHLVWHTFTCSPAKFGIPGDEYFAGTHINRNVTWHQEADAMVRYLGRCQWMLQQGLPVADYLVWAGDCPSQGFGHYLDHPYDGSDLKLPRGVNYDVIDTRTLLEGTKIENGRMVFPGGMTYEGLVLAPKKPEAMTASVEALVGDWRAKGVRIVDKRDAAVYFNTLVPDFEAPDRFRATHRRQDATDIYFVIGEGRCEAKFRVAGKQAELWDAVTGERRPVYVRTTADGRSAVWLNLPKSGSVFVVFGPQTPAPARQAPRCLEAVPVRGPWRATFEYHPGITATPPAPRELPLGDFSKNPDFDVAHFSGTVVYSTTFAAPSVKVAGGRISLGHLERGLARVKVNGHDLGVVWTAPWEIEVPGGVLKTGENRLEIRFVNTWANRLIGDCKVDSGKRVTRSNLAYHKGGRIQVGQAWNLKPTVWSGYCEKDGLYANGLYGPVVVRFMACDRGAKIGRDIPYDRSIGSSGLGDLRLPPNVDENTPFVLTIHGGGWAYGDRPSWAGVADFFTEELGFASYNITYRLASPKNPWPACGDDCIKAARFVLSEEFKRKHYHPIAA